MSGGGGGGGGGGAGGQSEAYYDNIARQDLINAEMKRANDEAAASSASAEAKSASAAKRTAARAKAENDAIYTLSSRGIDGEKYRSVIQRGLDSISDSVPDDDPNPAQYFTTDAINNIISGEENNRRQANTGLVDRSFAPGWERGWWGDEKDDQYINEILSGQRGEANQSLDFAKKRGQLNDFGYSGAVSKLGEQESGAYSTLSSLGTGVLDKYRATLKGVKDRATEAANNYTLSGGDFSIDPYVNEARNESDSMIKNLRGDIVNALGGTKLFNVNDILLAGSRQQGPQNLSTANVPATTPKDKSKIDRGLGSTSQF